MNYQHAYHAGGIADVFKHVILVQLLKNLHKKSSAFTYFETHAGNAIYNLQDMSAQKTLEYATGISMLWQHSNITHPALNDYLTIIRTINPLQDKTPSAVTTSKNLNYYPGSGLFARHCLRQQDEAILCELHPDVYQNLYTYFKQDKQVHVHRRNGYEALSALLPPPYCRGLTLIDPPFEIPNEFQQIHQALQRMQARWLNGMYAIWFPIKKYEIILQFYHELQKLQFSNILAAEFWSAPETADNRIKGSGLIILNPPWQFDNLLHTLLPTLAQALNLIFPHQNKLIWLKKM